MADKPASAALSRAFCLDRSSDACAPNVDAHFDHVFADSVASPGEPVEADDLQPVALAVVVAQHLLLIRIQAVLQSDDDKTGDFVDIRKMRLRGRQALDKASVLRDLPDRVSHP